MPLGMIGGQPRLTQIVDRSQRGKWKVRLLLTQIKETSKGAQICAGGQHLGNVTKFNATSGRDHRHLVAFLFQLGILLGLVQQGHQILDQ